MKRVVFELQTVDWRNDNRPIPTEELADTIRALYALGVQHVGYYPDVLFREHPDARVLRPALDARPCRAGTLRSARGRARDRLAGARRVRLLVPAAHVPRLDGRGGALLVEAGASRAGLGRAAGAARLAAGLGAHPLLQRGGERGGDRHPRPRARLPRVRGHRDQRRQPGRHRRGPRSARRDPPAPPGDPPRGEPGEGDRAARGGAARPTRPARLHRRRRPARSPRSPLARAPLRRAPRGRGGDRQPAHPEPVHVARARAGGRVLLHRRHHQAGAAHLRADLHRERRHHGVPALGGAPGRLLEHRRADRGHRHHVEALPRRAGTCGSSRGR